MGSIKNFSGFGGSLFKKSSSIGVDVGSRSIKVVELARKKDKFFLKNFVIAKTKKDLIKAGTAGVISENASKVIEQVFSKAKASAEKINASVPSFSSLITTIEIPRMPNKEIEQVVQIEAPKYIPVQLSDVVYGWQIIDEGNNMSGKESPDVISEAKSIPSGTWV